MAIGSSKGPWVMGISASHNGAVCLLQGDRIVCAIQEERLTRIKRQKIHGAAPALSIAYCLSHAGISAAELDLVVLCTQGRGRIAANDVARNPLLRPELHGLRIERISHHMGHAVSAFGLAGFDESAVLIIDGMGSHWDDLPSCERAAAKRQIEDGFETASLYHASGVNVEPLRKHFVARGEWVVLNGPTMPTFGSLGGIFAAASKQIFGTSTEPGKVMGLAPFGQPRFTPKDFFVVDNDEFTFSTDVPRSFQSQERWPSCSESYADLARSAQEAVEEGVLYLARSLKLLTRSSRLCYAGGVALNGIANERLFAEAGFDEIFIVPPAEDSGTAIGAAFWGLWHLTGENTHVRLASDALGRPYLPAEIAMAAQKLGGIKLVPQQDYIETAADLLCEGRIVGWFAGGSELGPRALGQRSILCDPRHPEMKETINTRVKRREAFQPFAPAILREDVADWFETSVSGIDSPFMLRVHPFKHDRLSQVPAVAHVDGTGRLQTLTESANGTFYHLVDAFKQRTGVPMLLNTSFNGRGEPIVETPEDALRCMLANGLDCCVFPGIVAVKV